MSFNTFNNQTAQNSFQTVQNQFIVIGGQQIDLSTLSPEQMNMLRAYVATQNLENKLATKGVRGVRGPTATNPILKAKYVIYHTDPSTGSIASFSLSSKELSELVKNPKLKDVNVKSNQTKDTSKAGNGSLKTKPAIVQYNNFVENFARFTQMNNSSDCYIVFPDLLLVLQHSIIEQFAGDGKTSLWYRILKNVRAGMNSSTAGEIDNQFNIISAIDFNDIQGHNKRNGQKFHPAFIGDQYIPWHDPRLTDIDPSQSGIINSLIGFMLKDSNKINTGCLPFPLVQGADIDHELALGIILNSDLMAKHVISKNSSVSLLDGIPESDEVLNIFSAIEDTYNTKIERIKNKQLSGVESITSKLEALEANFPNVTGAYVLKPIGKLAEYPVEVEHGVIKLEKIDGEQEFTKVHKAKNGVMSVQLKAVIEENYPRFMTVINESDGWDEIFHKIYIYPFRVPKNEKSKNTFPTCNFVGSKLEAIDPTEVVVYLCLYALSPSFGIEFARFLATDMSFIKDSKEMFAKLYANALENDNERITINHYFTLNGIPQLSSLARFYTVSCSINVDSGVSAFSIDNLRNAKYNVEEANNVPTIGRSIFKPLERGRSQPVAQPVAQVQPQYQQYQQYQQVQQVQQVPLSFQNFNPAEQMRANSPVRNQTPPTGRSNSPVVSPNRQTVSPPRNSSRSPMRSQTGSFGNTTPPRSNSPNVAGSFGMFSNLT